MAILILAACTRDPGLAAYERARAQADALLVAGKPITDPSYEEVLHLLASVPPSSRARARAEKLQHQLLAARMMAPMPLATSPGSLAGDPARAAKEAQCAALARALGLADAGQREDVARRLAECRREADRFRELRHHSAQP